MAAPGAPTFSFMSYAPALKTAGSLIGALVLILIIWIYGPAIGIPGFYPLVSVEARLVAIALVVILVLGSMLWRLIRGRRASRALEKGISQSASDDGKVLAERMRDALGTLKSAQGTSDYLYAIPWYLIIGPPGAGKTTALVNSGLKFPLIAESGRAMVEGVGGTRYCDWWFAEDAVLIDTAGRYTTQDSGAEGEENLDRRSWLAFLGLLRRHRPRQPINGVIIAYSAEDLMHQSEAERNAHADAVRTRLVELYDELKVAFPVYVLFTKLDLLAGFQEFFGDLREKDRQMVWGATFQTEERTKNTVGEVPPEFDALLIRLSETLLDRLQSEPNQARRSLVLGFPAQVSALTEPIVQFLSRVFEPTRYHANAILRGFYFSSGTQEGTAFDQLIGAQSRVLSQEPTAGLSGTGRSYFLFDLLKRVIFAEAGWVSHNRAALRRSRIVRGIAYAVIALATFGTLGLFAASYFANRSIIAEQDRAVEEYRVGAAALADEVEVASPDLAEPHTRLLYPLRTLPIGYASREAEEDLTGRLGLSQRGRLLSASEEAYHRALERSFRSRLILRVEELLQQNLNDPQFVYEALKVYRMLGGERVDDEIITAWVADDWEQNVYPGRLNADGRRALQAHLTAMLELDLADAPLVELNGPLVEEAERVLARVPLVDLAFARVRLEASADPSLSDWRLVDEGGSDVATVFETLDDTDVEDVGVAGFFTAEGFERHLLPRLATIVDDLQAEEWLFGEAANQRAIEAQYETLQDDLLRRYHREYIDAWRGLFDNLALRQVVADAPRYTVLRALSSPTSPLLQVMEAVGDELLLTQTPSVPPAGDADGEGDDGAPAAAATVQIAADVAAREAVAATLSTEPGTAVEAAFAPLLTYLAAEENSLASVVDALNEIHDRLVNLASLPQRTAEAVEAVSERVEALRTTAASLPQPISRLVLEAVKDIEGDITGAAVARLAQSFNDEVTRNCEAIVANRYPFFVSERDTPLADFDTLFAPDGLLATFRQQNLDALIDTSGEAWSWGPKAAELDLSDASLRQFQRAAEITDAFFAEPGEGEAQPGGPGFGLVVTSVALDPSASSGVLKIGRNFVHASRVARSTPIAWPGENSDNQAAVSVTFGPNARTERIGRSGPWALFRLVDAARTVVSGERLTADFVVAGKRLTFELAADTAKNPLTMRALREFRCPTGL